MKKLLLLFLCTVQILPYTYSRISTIERTDEESTVNGASSLWDNEDHNLVAHENNAIESIALDNNGNPVATGGIHFIDDDDSKIKDTWGIGIYNSHGIQQSFAVVDSDTGGEPFSRSRITRSISDINAEEFFNNFYNILNNHYVIVQSYTDDNPEEGDSLPGFDDDYKVNPPDGLDNIVTDLFSADQNAFFDLIVDYYDNIAGITDAVEYLYLTIQYMNDLRGIIEDNELDDEDYDLISTIYDAIDSMEDYLEDLWISDLGEYDNYQDYLEDEDEVDEYPSRFINDIQLQLNEQNSIEPVKAKGLSIDANNKIFVGGSQHDGSTLRWTWGRFSNPGLAQELLVVEKTIIGSIIDGISAGVNNGGYFAGQSTIKQTLLDGDNIWAAGTQATADGPPRWTIARYSKTSGARNLIVIEETDDEASILDDTAVTENGSWNNQEFFSGDGPGIADTIALDSSGNIWAGGFMTDSSEATKWTLVKYDSAGVRQIIIVENTGDGASILDSAGDATALATWDNGSNFAVETEDEEPTSARIIKIAIDNQDNIWACGIQNNGTQELWTVAKYNSAGERQLLIVEKTGTGSTLNGESVDWDNDDAFEGLGAAVSMIIDDNNNVFVAGEYEDNDEMKYWIVIKYNSNGYQKLRLVEKPNQTSTINDVTQSWDNGDNFSGGSGCVTLAFGNNQNTLWAGGYQDDGSDTTWAMAKYTLRGWPSLQAFKDHYPNKKLGLLN